MPEERDIGAELYELIRTDFERFLDEESPELPDINSANMKQADSYAHTVGRCLARAIAKHVKPEVLPDGRLYYNIAEKILDPTLRENHRLVNEFCGEIQKLINERQGINIRPQAAKYPEERAHALINAAAHEEDWDKTERILDDSVRTLTDSFYADNVKANADFRSKAGLRVEIVREGGSKCCPWCADLVGRYAYPDEVPKDVYRRHDNCTCSVTYVNGRARQNVWTKAQWRTPAERAERIALAKGKAKPTVFTKEQASALRERVGGLTVYPIKGSSEIKFAQVDGAGKVNKRFLQEYKDDYDKFVSVFGNLSLLAGFNVLPYKGGKTLGFYSPTSREISLLGIGGDGGKTFITQYSKNENKNGQWSTASPYHTFRHELGHALQAELQANDKEWDTKKGKITDFFLEMRKGLTELSEDDKIQYMKKQLSRYGFDDVGEFISESVAEYINSPKKARPTAKKVIEILLSKGDDNNGNQTG